MSTNFYTGDHSATIQAAALKAAALNPRKPKPRSSGTIKQELEAFKHKLETHTTALRRMEELRVELMNSLDALTARVAALRAEGVPELKLGVYLGYDFWSKSQDKSVHFDGTIEVTKAEIARLDRKIAAFAVGFKNLSEFTATEVPKLEAELAEALRLEKLQ